MRSSSSCSSTAQILLRIRPIPALCFEAPHLLFNGPNLRQVLRLCHFLEVEDLLELRQHKRLQPAFLAQFVVVDDHILQASRGRSLFALGEDHDVQHHRLRGLVRPRPQLVVDRDAIGPGHGELEVDGDALEDQADAAVRQQVLPRGSVPGVPVLADVPRPVATPALGEAHVHDIVDVAHRVLFSPDDALSVQARAVLVRQEPFAAGDQVAPVRP